MNSEGYEGCSLASVLRAGAFTSYERSIELSLTSRGWSSLGNFLLTMLTNCDKGNESGRRAAQVEGIGHGFR